MATQKILQFLALATVLFVCSDAAFPKRYPGSQVLAIMAPNVFLGDFEYLPTPDGYRLSYDLSDGTRHSEQAHIPNSADLDIYKSDPEAVAKRTGAIERNKARKLSPKALSSLAG